MLSDKQIIENFGVKKIIKKYPKSGQKQVMLIEHNEYGTVVLKTVEGESERVKREVSIVTENKFYNVPEVKYITDYEIDNEKGIAIFEQYIEGMTLREILTDRKLSINEILSLAEDMLKIIVQLEGRQIVHRDIKPDNIIKCEKKSWHLIDFGIARALRLNSLTLTQVQIGPHTPGYGAPELFQYSKKDIDSRADIFSLGVVLFEAATGKHPFVRGDELDLNEIWYNTITIMPEMITIDGDKDMMLMGLIQTFMQKHTTRRPRTAAKAMEWFRSVKANILEVV